MNLIRGSLFQHRSLILVSILCLFSYQSNAASDASNKIDSEFVKALYHSPDNNLKSDISSRLETFSALFLGKPYLLGALGEGQEDIFDQSPIYRFDAMDCETFVDTVLALALATDEDHFERCIRKVRYFDGQVSYIHRKHFTCLDWNINNQKQSFLKDITSTFKNKDNQPVSKVAIALIDKPSWYQHFTIKTIKLQHADSRLSKKRLKQLKTLGSKLPKRESKLDYIPLTSLFNANGKPNLYLFNQIPNGAIIEIVRPNWNLKDKIGTNLNVSHMGFAFWIKNILYFREASSIHHQIIDVPLIDYLHSALENPTIGGINVQVVVPSHPKDEICQLN